MHYGSGHIKAPALRKWRLWTVPHTPKAAELQEGLVSRPVAPERMHGPGPKELPDVGPSGAPYEFATAEQMRLLNRTEMKGQGVEVEQKNRRGTQKHAECWGLAYLLMKEALIESSLYPNPPANYGSSKGTFHLVRAIACLSVCKWKQNQTHTFCVSWRKKIRFYTDW